MIPEAARHPQRALSRSKEEGREKPGEGAGASGDSVLHFPLHFQVSRVPTKAENLDQDGDLVVTESPSWAREIVGSLKACGVRYVAHVPDTPLGHLLRLMDADPTFDVTAATREEEAVGIAAGIALGGGRPAVMMQTSGLGNALNALASLAVPYQVPMLLLISQRGACGEWNVVQVPGGRMLRPVLDVLGIQHFTLEREPDVGQTVRAAGDLAFGTRLPAALILSKLLTGWGA